MLKKTARKANTIVANNYQKRYKPSKAQETQAIEEKEWEKRPRRQAGTTGSSRLLVLGQGCPGPPLPTPEGDSRD